MESSPPATSAAVPASLDALGQYVAHLENFVKEKESSQEPIPEHARLSLRIVKDTIVPRLEGWYEKTMTPLPPGVTTIGPKVKGDQCVAPSSEAKPIKIMVMERLPAKGIVLSPRPRKPPQRLSDAEPAKSTRSKTKQPEDATQPAYIRAAIGMGHVIFCEPQGRVKINGKCFSPEKFKWWKDLNGIKHLVYMPAAIWDSVYMRWIIRCVFMQEGVYTAYHGFDSDSCFESITTLWPFVRTHLAYPWFAQVGTIVPNVTQKRQAGEALAFPVPDDHVYKKGDSVIIKDLDQRGYIGGVYLKPDKQPVYRVYQESRYLPRFEGSCSTWIQTLGPDKVGPPLFAWGRTDELSYWWMNTPLYRGDALFDFWPTPVDGWKAGHLASVPGFATVHIRQCVRIEAVHDTSVDVLFPSSSLQGGTKSRYAKSDIMGPYIDWNLGGYSWPSKAKRVRFTPDSIEDDVLDLGANAIQGVELLQKKPRVLSACDPPSDQTDVLSIGNLSMIETDPTDPEDIPLLCREVLTKEDLSFPDVQQRGESLDVDRFFVEKDD